MAKIVPKGYADIGAYNEMDDYMQVMDWLSGIGGVYQGVKDKHVTDVSSSFTDLISIVDNISDEKSFVNLESQLKGLKTQAFDLGNEQLKVKANLADSVVSSARSDFNQFKNVFSNITKEYAPDGMFNKDNLTLDNIMSWDIDTLNEKYSQVDMYKAQFLNPDGAPKFKNFKAGDENVYTVAQNLTNFDKQIAMAMDSLLGDNKITMEEAQFILTARKADLEKHRTDVLTQSKGLINTYTTQSSQASRAISMLQKNQETTLFKLANEDSGLFNVFNSNPELMDTYNQYAGFTPSEMNETEDGAAIYANLIEGIEGSQLEYHTLKESEIARYNYWSPVPFYSDITADPFNLSNISVDDGEDDGDDDTGGDDVEELRSVSTEEGTFDDEGNLIVEKEPKKIMEFSALSNNEKKQVALEFNKAVKNNRELARLSPQEWYRGSMAQSKKIDKPTKTIDVNSLLGGLSAGLSLTQKDKNYIQKNVKSMASRPFYDLLGMIRKYKSSTDSSEKQTLKSQIEKIIK